MRRICNCYVPEATFTLYSSDCLVLLCTYLLTEQPGSPHNVSVERVTSTSVTLKVTSLASLANQPPITSWRVNYSSSATQVHQRTSDFAADSKQASTCFQRLSKQNIIFDVAK